MLLILNRHALAAEQDPVLFPDDTLRPLLTKGKRIQRRMSRRLNEAGLSPTRVYSSPWTRAWQTARIILQESGLSKADRIACDAMAAPPGLAGLAQAIGAAGPGDRIALVGHEPWMSMLASLILSGTASGMSIDFPKSGILGIEAEALEPAQGVLRFFWRP